MSVCILGIDPGLTRCGFGVIQRFDDHRISYTTAGIFTTSPQENISKRLSEILNDITELVQEVKPDVIAIERVLFQKNTSTAMSVAQVSGLVHSVASTNNIEVTEYSPNEVKKIITGDGRADKVAVASMVVKLLGLAKTPQPADAADALAIAITHSFNVSTITNSSDSSDNATYNGSNLHNAIADAITKQTARHTKDIESELLTDEELERQFYEKMHLAYDPQRRYRSRKRGLSR